MCLTALSFPIQLALGKPASRPRLSPVPLADLGELGQPLLSCALDCGIWTTPETNVNPKG